MSCILVKNKEENIIEMKDLPGGKLAVILRPIEEDACVEGGMIVQRETGRGCGFIVLGGACVPDSDGFDGNCTVLVRILEEGELIEVKYS